MSKKADLVTIHPVPGYFVLGVATTTHELPSDEAAALVATGAFTFDPPTTETPDEPAQPEE